MIPGVPDRRIIVRVCYGIRVACQFVFPALKKFLAVDSLVTFYAAGDVRA